MISTRAFFAGCLAFNAAVLLDRLLRRTKISPAKFWIMPFAEMAVNLRRFAIARFIENGCANIMDNGRYLRLPAAKWSTESR